MARSVYVLEICTVTRGADAHEVNSVAGVYATLRKAQQSAEKSAWPLPPGQVLAWKDLARNADDEAFQAIVTAKTTTRYAITRHYVH